MDVTHLLVVRHGQSEWNALGRWQGHADPPLSQLGRRQSAAAADLLPTVDGIVSSDLRRASETAEIIAARRGIEPVIIDQRLRERDVGEWSGLTRAEIDRGWPGWVDGARLPSSFEDVSAVVERVSQAFAAINSVNPGASILVVTHGGVIRALERSHGATEAAIANLGGLRVRVSPAGLVIGGRLDVLDDQPDKVTRNEEL